MRAWLVSCPSCPSREKRREDGLSTFPAAWYLSSHQSSRPRLGSEVAAQPGSSIVGSVSVGHPRPADGRCGRRCSSCVSARVGPRCSSRRRRGHDAAWTAFLFDGSSTGGSLGNLTGRRHIISAEVRQPHSVPGTPPLLPLPMITWSSALSSTVLAFRVSSTAPALFGAAALSYPVLPCPSLSFLPFPPSSHRRIRDSQRRQHAIWRRTSNARDKQQTKKTRPQPWHTVIPVAGPLSLVQRQNKLQLATAAMSCARRYHPQNTLACRWLGNQSLSPFPRAPAPTNRHPCSCPRP